MNNLKNFLILLTMIASAFCIVWIFTFAITYIYLLFVMAIPLWFWGLFILAVTTIIYFIFNKL